MAPTPISQPAATVTDTRRRDAVLESALLTFARYGYRKTSMEQVARSARISRPGLYFLFASKGDLFRAAVTRALQTDLATVERILASTDQPLSARLLESFDEWAGRYVGALTRDISTVIESNPDLLGAITVNAPGRFQQLITNALAAERGLEAALQIAPTLISTSIGIKHQVDTREDYRAHLDVAITLLVGS
ncbi:MAG: TetR/AcrR family transcriptional regulator [Actinomycetota bacterium]|nr:TetR/AcrR family transcriptional regulator [Actinomycetota bacterium]